MQCKLKKKNNNNDDDDDDDDDKIYKAVLSNGL